MPELLDFSKDLSSLEPCAKVSFFGLTNDKFTVETGLNSSLIKNFLQIQLKFLAEEMQAISKGLEKVVQELSMSENDGVVSENFRKVSMTTLILHNADFCIPSNSFISFSSGPLYPVKQK